MRINIEPLKGIILNEKELLLGINRKEVITILGEPFDNYGKRDYYYNSELAIDYDNNFNIEFIEFLGGYDGSLKPYIYDFNIFEDKADKLIDLLKDKNIMCDTDSNIPYEYIFKSISFGVTREMNPDEFIKENTNNPMFEELEKKANYFNTCGIGAKDYYKKGE